MRYAVISLGLTISQLQDEVKKYGGRNLKVAPVSKQIFCDLDDAVVSKLREVGCIVNKVRGVKTITMPPIVTPPTPIAAVPVYTPEELLWVTGLEELRSVTEPPLYGSGMNIAIIGTGIRETHNKINGRVVYSKNYTSDPMEDGFDHETGVCSIVVTIAPECNVLNMKVLDSNGEGTEEEVVLAIEDCILLQNTQPEIAPHVMNLSLGSPDDANPDNPMRVACRAAIDKNIWITASAGNLGPSPYSITCPACERYVYAIGSIKYEPFIISDFSSRGPTLEGLIKPDAVIFGENITVASSESDIATIAKSGTSFAAPFASGIILIYHEGVIKRAVTMRRLGVLPPGEMYVVSIKEAVDVIGPLVCIKPETVAPGKDSDYGYGLPYPSLMASALRLAPLVDISAMLTPILGIAMLGMIMVPMTRMFK